MARPRKKGLSYFPFDIDIFEDEKLFDLQNQYGPLGEVIYLRLLCLVYKNGYYFRFDSKEKLAAMIIRSIGNRWVKDKKTVVGVIDYLAEINLFSSELMQRNILTSRGIQSRYRLVTERRQSEIAEYSLLEDESSQAGGSVIPGIPVSVAETPFSPPEKLLNVSSNAPKESKQNQTKENKSKANVPASPEGSAPPSPAQLEQLIYDYGKDEVERYTAKVRGWYADKGIALPDPYGKVREWLEKDNVEKTDHSLDKYRELINKF